MSWLTDYLVGWVMSCSVLTQHFKLGCNDALTWPWDLWMEVVYCLSCLVSSLSN